MVTPGILTPDSFQHYIQAFNAQNEELYPQHIPNPAPWPAMT